MEENAHGKVKKGNGKDVGDYSREEDISDELIFEKLVDNSDYNLIYKK